VTAIANAERSGMKNEQSLLNLICIVGAFGLFAFVGYNLLAAGTVISTDGLFFTVVPTVIALTFLAVPGQDFLSRQLAKRRAAKGETVTPTGSTARTFASASGAPATFQSAPALKDPKGRALPPDVNRMVAEMNKKEAASSE
jgi:hypothetical protein